MNERLCIWLSLLPTLFRAPATLAADTNVPAADPAKLADFMEKWRTSSTYEYPETRSTPRDLIELAVFRIATRPGPERAASK